MYFHEVNHQERALRVLRRGLAAHRAHHGYLFTGPEGVGKELTAQALAASLLCTNEQRSPEDEPCGACESCRLFAAGNHPDFHLVERGLHRLHPDRLIRSSKGLYLVVGLIRHFLIEPANHKPHLGRRRVFVIRDAERMNEEAQNALLKTLEEPPGEACLILLTSSADRLLPTIRSRCQNISFNLLPGAFVAEQVVMRRGATEADATALAALSGGRLGPALRWHRAAVLSHVDALRSALSQLHDIGPEAFGRSLTDQAATLAAALQEADADPGTEADESTSGSGKAPSTDELRDALKLLFTLVATLYRDALVASVTEVSNLHVLSSEALPAGGTDPDGAIRAATTAEAMLDRNVSPQLVCERLAVKMMGGGPDD